MGVGNNKTSFLIAGDAGCVTDSTFGNRVFNLTIVADLFQIGKGAAPVIGSTQCQSLTGLIAVCLQNDGNAFGTQAVLVVVIAPDLGDGNINGGYFRISIGYDQGYCLLIACSNCSCGHFHRIRVGSSQIIILSVNLNTLVGAFLGNGVGTGNNGRIFLGSCAGEGNGFI